MKKNLLFVMPSLSAGGGEKSLVNLLAQIDFELYNVDLFLFHPTGLFSKSVPKEVTIIEACPVYKDFTKSFGSSVSTFLKKGKLSLVSARILFLIQNRTTKNPSLAEQNSWQHVSKAVGKLEKEYDAAIGFLEKSSIYFIVEKVKAKKKIGWIHTNYSNSGMNKEYDLPYFKQLDSLVTVSEECAESLSKNFSGIRNKIQIMYNIVSPSFIARMAEQSDQDTGFNKEYINILTVARLSNEKGIDLAVEACKKLTEAKKKVRWYVIGEGSEKEKLEGQIRKYGIDQQFIFLGAQENPYPYFKQADIYVQPSRYEGKSIAIDEAKILKKPIVTTNFPTAKDQINHEINGLIVNMTPSAIAKGIEKIITDAHIKQSLIESLSNEELGTEHEINKLYAMV